MNKNPFSLYDFLGFVIPGGVTLIFVWLMLHSPFNSIFDVITIDVELMNLMSWNNVIILLLVSYIVGHFIAYLSTLTIERFALWNYEYPSNYLMGEKYPKSNYFKYLHVKKIPFWRKSILTIWKVGLVILVLPISILSLILGRLLRLNVFVLKPLDSYLQQCIELKVNSLIKKLNLPDISTSNKGEVDSLRIIYHYEYKKNTKQSKKMDNYVALYGFLRSIALIFDMVFIYLLIKYILLHFSQDLVSSSYVWLMILVGCVSYIFFISFMKFYRRYTLECYMALITDESLTTV